MKQKEKDLFSVRLKVVGGKISADRLPELSEIAKKYGRGIIHLTTRQGIEIPYVNFKDFDAVREELKEAGFDIGVCGPRIRGIVACQGEICSHGLINAQELSEIIDSKYFGLGGLPGKFKIGISGCPNACTKPYENDFGIIGKLEKEFLPENCNGCGLCAEVCPIKNVFIGDDNLAKYDPQKCIGCGECVFVCPANAWSKKREGYRIFVGGKMGKNPFLGLEVFTLWEVDDIYKAIDFALEFYKKYGKKSERFADVIKREGTEKFKKEFKDKDKK